MLKIRRRYMLQLFGGENLKKQSENVTEFDRDLFDLAKYMIKAMRELNGIGLAAVQIGVFKRLIVEFGSEICPYDEGCLSVPEVYAEVMRPRLIKVKAQDLSGNTLEFECGGLLARCIQHEVDHLNGLLFVDRLTEEVRSSVATELSAVQRRGRKFNYQRDIKL